ncbi:putative transmembrane protein [Medicago truncatula]|uniref:Putative transmembrane protein n=1 Tax=Medicago truncatula TaxID=3880 RepID=A0A396JE89_MEDTR|nr:putative transmembrane protein [Medicago truncatula]
MTFRRVCSFRRWLVHILLRGSIVCSKRKLGKLFYYFDPVLWSGPRLALAMIILINTLFSLCYLIIKWRRAELRHCARTACSKQKYNNFY